MIILIGAGILVIMLLLLAMFKVGKDSDETDSKK